MSARNIILFSQGELKFNLLHAGVKRLHINVVHCVLTRPIPSGHVHLYSNLERWAHGVLQCCCDFFFFSAVNKILTCSVAPVMIS